MMDHDYDDEMEDDPDDEEEQGNVMEGYHAERRRRIRGLKIMRRRIRDAVDPYDVTYTSFVKSYRLSQTLVLQLVELMRPLVQQTTSALALPLELKTLAVFSFYATGSYQTPLGKNFDFCIAQPTMSTYIEDITNALCSEEIACRFIRFPANVQEMEICMERNKALGGRLERVAGYVDGTLVKIRKQSVENNQLAYIGRKGYSCINVQVTCDRRMYVSNVVARFPGSTTDAFIYRSSALHRKMQELFAQTRCHLVGDSGYPLEPWCMTPFARDDRPMPDTPEGRYNKAQCADRNVVERTIGYWKGGLRSNCDERVLHYDAEKAYLFVIATMVVHNIRVLTNLPEDVEALMDNDDDDGEENEEDNPDVPLVPPNVPLEGPDNILLRGRLERARHVEELEAARARRHQVGAAVP